MRLERRKTSRNKHGQEGNVGQDVNEKQLHARQYGSPLIGVRAGREERCFWMSWQQSTSGLRQILGVNRPPSNVP